MKLSLARILGSVSLTTAALALLLASPSFAQSHLKKQPPPGNGDPEIEDGTEGAPPAPEIAPAAFGGLVLLVAGGALVLSSRRVRAEAR